MQVPELEAIIVPVSGGGMISGIAVAAKALKPGIKVCRGVRTGWQPVVQPVKQRFAYSALCHPGSYDR